MEKNEYEQINLFSEGDFIMIKIHAKRKAGISLPKYEGPGRNWSAKMYG